MLRETECTLRRQRYGSYDDRLIDQGSVEDMIQRVLDQPRGMRGEYTIVQGETVYQPEDITSWAQKFGLGEVPAASNTEEAGGAYFRPDEIRQPTSLVLKGRAKG